MDTLAPDAPQMKPWIAAMHAYVPGKARIDGRPVVARLASNENPFGPSPQAIAAMQAALADGHRYPDPASTGLREALAALHGLDPARIVAGTGSDELIHLAASAFAGPGDEVIHVRHGFAVYELAARRVGADVVVAPDRDYVADVDALLALVTPRTRVVYLANPNNPTGTIIPASEVRRLHAALPGHVLFVLDCAYAEFAEGDYEDGLALADRYPNVFAIRTFSKIYGLAAQRIGWGYAAAPVIAALHRVRAPFNVPTTGQAAAVAAVADQLYIERVRAHTLQWRRWLQDEIETLNRRHNAGIRVLPPAANFLLLECAETGPFTAAALNEGLLAAGIITRYLAVQAMPRCLRISIGTEAETRAAASALADILAAG
ncbi:histidinol-phosphate transaminase [Polymorphobacter sp.]|uniref:histidinol-phosphate transaminase n=1 Tax=Polymorphobacter sp. TaxID=1909290 RepID=UPI003F71765D